MMKSIIPKYNVKWQLKYTIVATMEFHLSTTVELIPSAVAHPDLELRSGGGRYPDLELREGGRRFLFCLPCLLFFLLRFFFTQNKGVGPRPPPLDPPL